MFYVCIEFLSLALIQFGETSSASDSNPSSPDIFLSPYDDLTDGAGLKLKEFDFKSGLMPKRFNLECWSFLGMVHIIGSNPASTGKSSGFTPALRGGSSVDRTFWGTRFSSAWERNMLESKVGSNSNRFDFDGTRGPGVVLIRLQSLPTDLKSPAGWYSKGGISEGPTSNSTSAKCLLPGESCNKFLVTSMDDRSVFTVIGAP